jgi:predicted neuraminidase
VPPASRDVDILIAGGGMAGCFAALGAALDACSPDLSILLVEPSNVLGGQGTAGGVAGFCGDTQRVNTCFARLVSQLAAHDLIDTYRANADRRPFDLEWCGFFLQEMVVAAGVDVLLHTRVIDAAATDGTIDHVDVLCGSDAIRLSPTFVVDATGDCAIAVKAGFPTFHEPANRQLPMSLYFTLWDTRQRVTPVLPVGCPTWEDDDDLPMTTLHRFDSGKIEVKMKVVGFDAASGESLSQAEIHARRQMLGLLYHLQTKGYAGQRLDTHVLASVSRHIGQREGRRLHGEYVLTEQDVTQGAVFADAVAVGTYHLDFHWPDRVQRAGTGITTMVEPYHIPLRSLIAKGSTNLLTAGRSLSGEQMAMSSYRVQATCAQTGFAAGCAARVAVQGDHSLRDLPVDKVQAALSDGGQSLDLADYGDYLRAHSLAHEFLFDAVPPAPSCHASSLVHLPNNRFLVTWFGGTREGHDDVGIWCAERDATRWSAPRQVAKVRHLPHWNPVLFVAPNGDVHLFFKVSIPGRKRGSGHSVADGWQTWRLISTDDGRTWGEPHPLVQTDHTGRGPVKNKPILLADGSWLAGASVESDDHWDLFVDRSQDGGATWQATDLLRLNRQAVTGKGAIQPTLWESTPGHVHLLARSTGGFVCRADSVDSGHTWSEVVRTDLPNNNSGLDLAQLPDGTLALVCNPVPRQRTPLSILLSHDNGYTWTQRLDLETDAGEYSYPAIIAVPVGLAVSYTWRRTHIRFWMGSIERFRPV